MIILIILLSLNFRYPFYSLEGGPWSVGFTTSNNILDDLQINESNVISYSYIDSLVPEKIFYIADPFFLKEDGQWYLFVELKGKDNANIALLTSENGKNFEYQGVVLDEDFHLSYPQVFKYRKEFYMLPETKGSNQVLLYKAKEFPFAWEISDTLLRNHNLKDPTILLSDEINLIIAADDNLKQMMFTADSLKGEWKEVERYKQRLGNETRPGGRFFKAGGDWFIPLQNRSKGYGTGISLYRLETKDNFVSLEKEVSMYLGPQKFNWFNRGMHHLDIQEHDGEYFIFYDGDENLNGKKNFQYKRTFKLALYDILNFFS